MKNAIEKLYYEIQEILLSHGVEPHLKIITTDYAEFEYERRINVNFDYFVNKKNALGWIMWEFFDYEVVAGHFNCYSPNININNFLLVSKSKQEIEILPANSVLNLVVEDYVSGKYYKISELIDIFNKIKSMNILLSKI